MDYKNETTSNQIEVMLFFLLEVKLRCDKKQSFSMHKLCKETGIATKVIAMLKKSGHLGFQGNQIRPKYYIWECDVAPNRAMAQETVKRLSNYVYNVENPRRNPNIDQNQPTEHIVVDLNPEIEKVFDTLILNITLASNNGKVTLQTVIDNIKHQGAALDLKKYRT